MSNTLTRTDDMIHRGEIDMISTRLERFSTKDLVVIRNYMHANFEPSLDGLVEHIETVSTLGMSANQTGYRK